MCMSNPFFFTKPLTIALGFFWTIGCSHVVGPKSPGAGWQQRAQLAPPMAVVFLGLSGRGVSQWLGLARDQMDHDKQHTVSSKSGPSSFWIILIYRRWFLWFLDLDFEKKTLVMTNVAIWKITMFNGTTHCFYGHFNSYLELPEVHEFAWSFPMRILFEWLHGPFEVVLLPSCFFRQRGGRHGRRHAARTAALPHGLRDLYRWRHLG